MTDVDSIVNQIVAWLEEQAAKEQALLDGGTIRPDARERTQERWLTYKGAVQGIRERFSSTHASMPDEDFAAFVERHRQYGYGRMMHVISELWRQKDPRAALSVGETYAMRERKRERCTAQGHDVRHGNSYDWCDRCGAQLDPDSGAEL